MRKLAFCNAKGGVGKTTSCVNVGAGLARLGYRTLLIDADSQGQVAPSLGIAPSSGLAELIAGEASLQQVQVEARGHLFVIAGGKGLSGVKRAIARREVRPELVLAEALQGLQGCDFVLLDTAPSWDVLNVNSLFYAQELAVPVSMEALALQGLAAFMRSVGQVQRYHETLQVRWIIPTFYDARVRKSQEILAQLRAHFGPRVTAPIRYNVRLSEAPGYGQPIFEYARRSSGAIDYAHLVEEIIA